MGRLWKLPTLVLLAVFSFEASTTPLPLSAPSSACPTTNITLTINLIPLKSSADPVADSASEYRIGIGAKLWFDPFWNLDWQRFEFFPSEGYLGTGCEGRLKAIGYVPVSSSRDLLYLTILQPERPNPYIPPPLPRLRHHKSRPGTPAVCSPYRTGRSSGDRMEVSQKEGGG